MAERTALSGFILAARVDLSRWSIRSGFPIPQTTLFFAALRLARSIFTWPISYHATLACSSGLPYHQLMAPLPCSDPWPSTKNASASPATSLDGDERNSSSTTAENIHRRSVIPHPLLSAGSGHANQCRTAVNAAPGHPCAVTASPLPALRHFNCMPFLKSTDLYPGLGLAFIENYPVIYLEQRNSRYFLPSELSAV